jgi:hypothetical protein
MNEHAFIFVINFFNIVIIEIVYNALMHKIECGQSYCKDLLKRILWRFILRFCDIYSVFYELLKFNEFLKIVKQFQKSIKVMNSAQPIFGS